jgi:DNA replication and repair protein RecF
VAVQSLALKDFRCFASATVPAAAPGTNLFFGENGSGKTTLLEAIHVLGAGRSFRVRDAGPLVRHTAPAFVVGARLVEPPYALDVRGGTGKLEATVNGRPAAGTTELASLLPVQALHPEMHGLVEGGPEVRRRFLDWGAFHVKRTFLESWRRYHRALRQRNAALKLGADARSVDIWVDELVENGEVVDEHRRAHVDALAQAFRAAAHALTGADATLEYRSGWERGLSLAEAMNASERRDRSQRATQVGPHRADLRILLGDRPARHTASRGQQKLLAISLGFAQARVIAEAADRGLVLLLDDPMAEIDQERRNRLAMLVEDVPAQRFVTALTLQDYAGPVETAFHVKQGELGQVI